MGHTKTLSSESNSGLGYMFYVKQSTFLSVLHVPSSSFFLLFPSLVSDLERPSGRTRLFAMDLAVMSLELGPRIEW